MKNQFYTYISEDNLIADFESRKLALETEFTLSSEANWTFLVTEVMDIHEMNDSMKIKIPDIIETFSVNKEAKI